MRRDCSATWRSALTLLELLVAITILAIVIGMLLPAVQQVRLAAQRTAVCNQLRQISLASQSYSQLNGPLPPPSPSNRSRGGGNVFSVILPYLEHQPQPSATGLRISSYLSLSDPSIAHQPSGEGNCSFAVNSLLCWRSGVPIAEEITDGTSNTIAFSERFARCQQTQFIWSLSGSQCRNGLTGQIVPCGPDSSHRATFVDRMYIDALPVQSANGTTSTMPGATFQTQPLPSDCDGRILQSSFRSGLIVALADGGIRNISPGIAHSVYWSAFTPDGQEVLGDW